MYLFIFISTKICPHPKVKWYANAIFKVILFSFSLEILIDLKSILSCMWDTVSVTFHTGVTSVPCTCASSLYPPLPALSLPHTGLDGWFRGLLSLYPTSTRPWVFLTWVCTGGSGVCSSLYSTSAWPCIFLTWVSKDGSGICFCFPFFCFSLSASLKLWFEENKASWVVFKALKFTIFNYVWMCVSECVRAGAYGT